MKVDLGGLSVPEARAAAGRFLEATEALREAGAVRPSQKMERRREREKVRLTTQCRRAIENAMEGMRAPIERAAGLREDDLDDFIRRLLTAIEGLSGAELFAVFNSYGQQAIAAGITEASLELKLATAFSVQPKAALATMQQALAKLTAIVTDREKAALRATLHDGLAQGLTGPEIAQRLGDTMRDGIHYLGDDGTIVRTMPTDTWANMVARTEMNRAMNDGIVSTYRSAGISEVVFTAASDACPECADLDGETFSVNDSDNLPPIHPNCRCGVVSAESAGALAVAA